MTFNDRTHAGSLLAERLLRYAGQRPLVLAIPRGAVPMGRVLADALGGDLDVALVHKLGAPDNPEFAIGAVSESGQIFVNPGAQELGLAPGYIEAEAEAQLATIRRRRAAYTQVRPPEDPAGRVVIVVDDGIATGATMGATLQMLRRQGPRRLIVATAVAPADALERLRRHADEVVCLLVPERFHAVSPYFRDFHQVTDEEVVALLRT